MVQFGFHWHTGRDRDGCPLTFGFEYGFLVLKIRADNQCDIGVVVRQHRFQLCQRFQMIGFYLGLVRCSSSV